MEIFDSVRTLWTRLTKGKEQKAQKLSNTERPGLVGVTHEAVLDRDGCHLVYKEIGPKDAPVTVVFIHGFTLAADSFFMVTDYLRAQFPNVKSLLMDLRGHGETGEMPAELLTIDACGDDILALIRERSPQSKIIFVGHSMGGLIALNALKKAPDNVAGLVLIASSIESLSSQGLPQVLASPLADKAQEAVELAPGDAQKMKDALATVLAPALSATVFKRNGTDYNLVEFHASMIDHTPLETFVGFFDDLQEHDELDAASSLQGVPGYILVGKKDDVTPEPQADRIKGLWPQAQEMRLDKAGHMLILETPDAVNEAIGDLVEGALGAIQP